MKKLFTILSFHLLMILVTVTVSCTHKHEEKNVLGLKIEPLIIDSSRMYQMNESGNVIETLDTAVRDCKINYKLSGDTLNATITIPKIKDEFHWNALFDFSVKDKDYTDAYAHVFSTKAGNRVIFHVKEKKVITFEVKNDRDRVIFYIR